MPEKGDIFECVERVSYLCQSHWMNHIAKRSAKICKINVKITNIEKGIID